MNLLVTLTPEQLAELARQIAPYLEPPQRAEWLSVQEAAEYACCSKQRIYDLRSAGRLPKTGDGSRVLVRRTDLDDYLERV